MSRNSVLRFNLIFLVISISLIFPMNFGEVYGKALEGQQIEQTCGVPSDVKSSLTMSIISLCIPGILEKFDSWRQIKCEEVVCKYNAVKFGLDLNLCEQQASLKECRYIVGEIFSIPPASIINMYLDAIKELITNPVGIATSLAIIALRDYVSITCSAPGPTCRGWTLAGAMGLFVVDTKAAYDRIKNVLENGFNLGSNNKDFCEDIPEIKEEMKNIIKSYSILQQSGGNQ